MLLISSLEALAIIIALKIFFPATGTDSKKLINLVPTWTDNRGNGSALNKLMLTRYLASALLMELASHMKHEKINASVSWAPREVNREADRLANGDTTGFDPNLQVHIVSSAFTWYVLEDALIMGREAEQTFDYVKSAGLLPTSTRREKRKRQSDRLKFADPW